MGLSSPSGQLIDIATRQRRAIAEIRGDENAAKSRAYLAATKAVRERLGVSSSNVGALGENGCGVLMPKTDRYRCSGWVESKNAFGATTRSAWTADLRGAGESFVVEAVSIARP